MRIGTRVTQPKEKLKQDRRLRQACVERSWELVRIEVEKRIELVAEIDKVPHETEFRLELMVLSPRGLEKIRDKLVKLANLHPQTKKICEEIDYILTNGGL